MNEISEEMRLLRNLKDAGCDEDTIKKYVRLEKEGRRRACMHRLWPNGAS